MFFTHVFRDPGGLKRSVLHSIAHSYVYVCALMFIVMAVADKKCNYNELSKGLWDKAVKLLHPIAVTFIILHMAVWMNE